MRRSCLALTLAALLAAAAASQDAPPERAQQLAQELAAIQKLGGDHLGFAAEALAVLRDVFAVTPAAEEPRPRHAWHATPQPAPGLDIYALLSGGLALRESLQLDRIAASPPGAARTVELATLVPPRTPSHPFAQLLEGRTWKASPLARSVPHDFYYFHFNSMGAALSFASYADEVGGLLVRRYAPRAVDFHVKEKILTQLALRVSPRARTVYDAVAAEVALVGSDPFLREGTDVTVLLRLKAPKLFRMSIGAFWKYFEVTRGATPVEATVAGLTARGLVTPDRTVNAWLLPLADGLVALSNTREALQRVVLAHRGERPSLHDQLDFRYLRSIFPADREAEDGFLYLSEAFLRHLVGPELRIREARRMAEAVRLATLERYAMLFHQLVGRVPRSVEEVFGLFGEDTRRAARAVEALKTSDAWEVLGNLSPYFRPLTWEQLTNQVRSRLLVQAAATRRRAAGPESLARAREIVQRLQATYESIAGVEPRTPREALELVVHKHYPPTAARFAGLELVPDSRAATSRTLGRYGRFRSNLALDVRRVTEREARAYRAFARGYERYWRGYFDPIGLRVKLGETRRLELCVLPLVENSVYDTVRTLVGARAAPLAIRPLPEEVFSLGLKLGRGDGLDRLPMLREAEREVSRELRLPPLGKLLAALGDTVEIHALDARPLLDFDASLLLGNLGALGAPDPDLLAPALLGYAAFHPLRLAVPVKDEARAEAALDRFTRALLERSGSLAAGRGFVRMPLDLDVYHFEHHGARVRVVRIGLAQTLFVRLFCAIHDGRLHVTTTEEHIKRVLSARADLPTETLGEGQVFLTLRPARLRRERATFERTVAEKALRVSRRNAGTLRLLARLFPGAADLPARCLATFGFEPVSPAGGRYAVDRATGAVTDSMFGDLAAPRLSVTAVRAATGVARFLSTERLSLVLHFTPEGLRTAVEIR